MKNIYKILIVCILFSLSSKLYAQNDSLNTQKYWHYRERLKYFVIPGTQRGESQIAGIRNRFDYGTDDINFGQHTIHFGYYIGMLATEFKLLNDANASKAKET